MDMAKERLQAGAERIGDEEMKRLFLAAVPYHREIVQAVLQAGESG